VRVRQAPFGTAEHAERLVADLVPMTVRTVQEVAAPAFADTRDVRDLVPKTGGQEDSPGRQGLPVVEVDVEPREARRS